MQHRYNYDGDMLLFKGTQKKKNHSRFKINNVVYNLQQS